MEPNESDLSSEGSDFVATDEMLTLAYDDESTINDEEDIAEEDDEADEDEIQNLKLVSLTFKLKNMKFNNNLKGK